MSTQPTYPNFPNVQTGSPSFGNLGQQSGGGGWQDFLKDNTGSLLAFAGNLLAGGQNKAVQEAQLKLQEQALAQQGQIAQANLNLATNSQAMGVNDRLNRAPLADRGQYLAMNAAAPTAFQPRDYTQGLGQMRTPTVGGAQQQLAANSAAAANYKAGAGGVNTDTMKLILSKLGFGNTPQTEIQRTTYNGHEYTPQEWDAYTKQNPNWNQPTR